MNTITIRPFQTEDTFQVLELFDINSPNYFAPEERKDFLFYLENEIENYYVVLYDEKIVGCGGINFDFPNKTGKISWDIIHSDFQGKRIGSKLLQYRIQILQENKDIEIVSVRTSQHAYKFYQSNGFELIEIIDDYWAEDFDLYRMIYNNKKDLTILFFGISLLKF